jgi:hypothetical protein
MKFLVFSILLGFVWWTARGATLPIAAAVVPEAPQPLPAVDSPAPELPVPVAPAPVPESALVQRVEIPIAWQRTKAQVVGKGTSTLTESFREVWTLELRPGGYLFLTSPHARVSVYPAGGPESRATLPRSVVLAVGDFARLVGVTSSRPDSVEGEGGGDAPATAGRPLTLNLAKSVKGGSDITLAWSEDEHYAIHLDISSVALF